MDETGSNVRFLQILLVHQQVLPSSIHGGSTHVLVIRPEDVGGDDTSEDVSVLVKVGAVLDIDDSLSVGITEIRGMRGSQVDLVLSQGSIDLKIVHQRHFQS